MNTLELYWGATFLRGAFAVLLLLGAERFRFCRLGPESRRFLWVLCLALLVIPQMSLSVLPVKLDLSKAASPALLHSGDAAARMHSGGAEAECRKGSVPRAVWRFLIFHRRKIEAAALAGLPLPALLLLLVRYLRCRKQVRRLPPVTDHRVLESWTRLLGEAGALRRPVILLDSSVIGLGPTLFGCFRRKLLLPVERLKDLSDKELSLLLEHEYQHCRSGDDLLNLVALVVWALCWYNPFLLIARRKVRSCCELACDRALLLRHPGAVREYGVLLLKFASPSANTAVAIGLSESPRELSRRIRVMTVDVASSHRARLAGRAVALLLGGMIAAPLLLVAVDVRPAGAPSGIAAGQPAPKPLLPYLVLGEVAECEADGTPVGCWKLDYSDSFPAENSELILEFTGIRRRIALANKPRSLRLFRRETGGEPGWDLETSESSPVIAPESAAASGAEERIVRADRKMVYTSVPGSVSPVAFSLEVDGIGPENLGDYRRP